MPAAGSALTTTALSALAGESDGSLKPKSAVFSATLASSSSVIVLSAPEGASLTAVMVSLKATVPAEYTVLPPVPANVRLTAPPLVIGVPPVSISWALNAVAAPL